MNTEKFTTVTYTLANGAKIAQPITKESFFDIKGRRKNESQLHKIFQETAWDKGAISYTVDSDTDETVIVEKEIHFTKNEKKIAKRDYEEYKKSNPNGFNKSLFEFQKQFVDTLSKNKRIRMNIANVKLT
jgi:hypothetical protein